MLIYDYFCINISYILNYYLIPGNPELGVNEEIIFLIILANFIHIFLYIISNIYKNLLEYFNSQLVYKLITVNLFSVEFIKFVSGPFTSLIFEVLSKQSDKIEILIGKYKTTISKKSNFLYRPI